MKRYSKKVGVDWLKVKKATIEESKKKLSEAWKKFNKSKKNFPEWRRHHLESLIEAIAEEKKISKKIIKAIMKREEASRLLGRKSKRITGKGKKEPILRAVIKDCNGVEKELNTQSSMVSAIASSNKKRQQKCEGTPFHISPLVNEFGYLAEKNSQSKLWKERMKHRRIHVLLQ